MYLGISPSLLIKGIWFSFGTGAAYAGYRLLHKDLWVGARQVGCPEQQEAAAGFARPRAPAAPLTWPLPPPQVAQAHGTLPVQPHQPQPEPLFGPATRTTLASQWNALVDASVGRLAQELGKRGL